jgi:polar amino acid transport system permease protein
MSSNTLAEPSAAAEEVAPPRLVPGRHLGQRTAAVVVLVLLGFAVNSVVRNEAFQWDVVGAYFTPTAVLRGLWLTLWLTGVVMALGFALGTLLAAARLSANPVLRGVSWGYVPRIVDQVIPLLMVATLWYVIVTSVLGVGQYYVEKYYARGAEHTR